MKTNLKVVRKDETTVRKLDSSEVASRAGTIFEAISPTEDWKKIQRQVNDLDVDHGIEVVPSSFLVSLLGKYPANNLKYCLKQLALTLGRDFKYKRVGHKLQITRLS